MKTTLAVLVLSFSLSALAQWTHPGEEPSTQMDCSSIYDPYEVPECSKYTERLGAQMDYEFAYGEEKRLKMVNDENFLDNLRAIPGCEKANPASKKLSKMNEAELCRRQLMDQLDKEGFFKEIKTKYNKYN